MALLCSLALLAAAGPNNGLLDLRYGAKAEHTGKIPASAMRNLGDLRWDAKWKAVLVLHRAWWRSCQAGRRALAAIS